MSSWLSVNQHLHLCLGTMSGKARKSMYAVMTTSTDWFPRSTRSPLITKTCSPGGRVSREVSSTRDVVSESVFHMKKNRNRNAFQLETLLSFNGKDTRRNPPGPCGACVGEGSPRNARIQSRSLSCPCVSPTTTRCPLSGIEICNQQ